MKVVLVASLAGYTSGNVAGRDDDHHDDDDDEKVSGTDV